MGRICLLLISDIIEHSGTAVHSAIQSGESSRIFILEIHGNGKRGGICGNIVSLCAATNNTDTHNTGEIYIARVRGCGRNLHPIDQQCRTRKRKGSLNAAEVRIVGELSIAIIGIILGAGANAHDIILERDAESCNGQIAFGGCSRKSGHAETQSHDHCHKNG